MAPPLDSLTYEEVQRYGKLNRALDDAGIEVRLGGSKEFPRIVLQNQIGLVDKKAYSMLHVGNGYELKKMLLREAKSQANFTKEEFEAVENLLMGRTSPKDFNKDELNTIGKLLEDPKKKEVLKTLVNDPSKILNQLIEKMKNEDNYKKQRDEGITASKVKDNPGRIVTEYFKTLPNIDSKVQGGTLVFTKINKDTIPGGADAIKHMAMALNARHLNEGPGSDLLHPTFFCNEAGQLAMRPGGIDFQRMDQEGLAEYFDRESIIKTLEDPVHASAQIEKLSKDKKPAHVVPVVAEIKLPPDKKLDEKTIDALLQEAEDYVKANHYEGKIKIDKKTHEITFVGTASLSKDERKKREDRYSEAMGFHDGFDKTKDINFYLGVGHKVDDIGKLREGMRIMLSDFGTEGNKRSSALPPASKTYDVVHAEVEVEGGFKPSFPSGIPRTNTRTV